MKRTPCLLSAILLATGGLDAAAQNYELRHVTRSNGGGSCSGGPYRFDCTFGEPVSGPVRGGSYAYNIGFWHTVTVIQSPDAPTLTLQQVGGQILLSWPVSGGRFALQYTTHLGPSRIWEDSNAPVVDENGLSKVTVPIQPGSLFFRLKERIK